MAKDSDSRSSEPSKRIAVFGEDSAHQTIIDGLIQRVSKEISVEAKTEWRNAHGGYGRVVTEAKKYFREVWLPDFFAGKYNPVLEKASG